MDSKSPAPYSQSDAEQELPILTTPADLPAQEQIPEEELWVIRTSHEIRVNRRRERAGVRDQA
jgi:hypothetical protein